MNVLANDGVSQVGIDRLKQAGYAVITDKVAQENLVEYINENNISCLLVRSATTARKELIDACPGLKLIGRGGVGMDNIDVAYARDKGLKVINTPAASSQSVAELVMGEMFVLSRFFYDSFKNMENGEFSKLKKAYAKGSELRGKKLGIVGFGRIGQSLASYALGAGMDVVAVDRFMEGAIDIKVPIGTEQNASVSITPKKDLQEVISSLDYLSLHVPKQADGSAVIGKNEFNAMKDGIKIVNAARGGVIDEDALIEALNTGKVDCIALDVYENEPNPRKDLLSHPKIACTPHIGAATKEAQNRIGEELAEQIINEFA